MFLLRLTTTWRMTLKGGVQLNRCENPVMLFPYHRQQQRLLKYPLLNKQHLLRNSWRKRTPKPTNNASERAEMDKPRSIAELSNIISRNPAPQAYYRRGIAYLMQAGMSSSDLSTLFR